MKQNRATVWTVATAGCLLLGVTTLAQSDPPDRRRTSGGSGGESRPPIRRNPVPLPERNAPPLGSTDRLPDVPPARGSSRNPSSGRDTPPAVPPDNSADERDPTQRPRHPSGHSDHWRHRRRIPTYYDPWPYDRYRYGDDGYRGYNPEPLDDPRDRPARDDEPDDGPMPPGAMLPPEEMLDDADAPPRAAQGAGRVAAVPGRDGAAPAARGPRTPRPRSRSSSGCGRRRRTGGRSLSCARRSGSWN